MLFCWKKSLSSAFSLRFVLLGVSQVSSKACAHSTARTTEQQTRKSKKNNTIAQPYPSLLTGSALAQLGILPTLPQQSLRFPSRVYASPAALVVNYSSPAEHVRTLVVLLTLLGSTTSASPAELVVRQGRLLSLPQQR